MRSALLSGAGAASAALTLPVAASAQEYVQPGFFYEVSASVEAGEIDPSVLSTEVRQWAIETRSDTMGRIAGARIGDSDLFVVYIETAGGCGSGGCRAQVWRYDQGEPVLVHKLEVGHLPIVLLPNNDSGAPSIGITSWSSDLGTVIVPISFSDKFDLPADWDRPLPAGSGRALVTDEMMESFQLEDG